MNIFQYNERGVTIGYEHDPIIASGNAVTGPRYRTKVYLVQDKAQYPLGDIDGKADEDIIRGLLAEIFYTNQERHYGQQTTLLRRELTPRREMLQGTSGHQSLRTRYKRSF